MYVLSTIKTIYNEKVIQILSKMMFSNDIFKLAFYILDINMIYESIINVCI